MKRDLDETNCSASSSSSPKRLKSDPTEVPASSEEKASNGVVETASPLDAFPVESLTRFQKRCASYQQPTEVGYFSYDEHRKLHLFSDKELKYYYQPEPNANLNEGYPQLFTKRDDSIPEHLDSLLECLTAVNQRAEQGGKPSIQPKFCTWRGIMTKIMCTPYLQNDAWELGATRYKGTIYIEEHETDERKQRKYGETDRDKLMTYWGYKFESLSTVSKPPSSITGPDDPELLERRRQPVNTNIQYCSVFNTKLGQNSILMGAEVDCLTGGDQTLFF
ncbi:decapping endonuclease targeting mRNA [Quaeritorhiza haematococci]|nr:decapping endonuclease targeting mRNA [Quaeritorhiza haematococci]